MPLPRPLLALGPDDRRRKPLNLGLQGGGAHGAFTWGVLDALLECESLSFDGISGASAGAINAVALAAGLLENGRAGARAKLAAVWQAIAGACAATADLAPASKLYPVCPLLEKLRDLGRTAASAWLDRHVGSLGSRSTVDLAARFL